MKGCRPLTEDEVKAVAQKLLEQSHTNGFRNRLLFLLGCKTGFRIAELLSLRVKDVFAHDKVSKRATVNKCNMKGEIETRSVVLAESVKPLLNEYIRSNGLKADDRLFPVTTVAAHLFMSKAFDVLRLDGKVATHSMRKTFANHVYKALNHDLVKTQAAMGHKWVSTTAQYISFAQEDVDEAILSAG